MQLSRGDEAECEEGRTIYGAVYAHRDLTTRALARGAARQLAQHQVCFHPLDAGDQLTFRRVQLEPGEDEVVSTEAQLLDRELPGERTLERSQHLSLHQRRAFGGQHEQVCPAQQRELQPHEHCQHNQDSPAALARREGGGCLFHQNASPIDKWALQLLSGEPA